MEISEPRISAIAKCCVIVEGNIFLTNLRNERLVIKDLSVETLDSSFSFVRLGESKMRFLLEPKETLKHKFQVAFPFDQAVIERVLSILKKYDETIDLEAPIYQEVDESLVIEGERESEAFLLYLSGGKPASRFESGSFFSVEIGGDSCEKLPPKSYKMGSEYYDGVGFREFSACVVVTVTEMGIDEETIRAWPVSSMLGGRSGMSGYIGRGWVPEALEEKRP